MEVTAVTTTKNNGTNEKPKRSRPRLSRRASMSALPSYPDESGKYGFNKKELKEAYKNEKKHLKKAHKEAERNFRKTIEGVQYEEVSGLAEEDETMMTKVNLETFSRPKASRRERRASLNMTLRILTPPSSPKLDLEEIEPVVAMSTSPLRLPPPTAFDRRGGLKKALSCQLDAEALAGWKTVSFDDGPLGVQLEPTHGERGARVTGFLDTAGVPSAARASGEIDWNDVIVKINATVPKNFDHALQLLQVGGKRNITFRPAFSYELEGLSSDKDGARRRRKKKDLGGSSSHHKKKDSLSSGSSHAAKKKEVKQQATESITMKSSPSKVSSEDAEPVRKAGIQIKAFQIGNKADNKQEKKNKDKKKKASSSPW